MRKLGVILAGILFIIIGIFIIINGNGKVKRCTEKTVGTVVEIKEDMNNDSEDGISYTYYPVIEYEANGSTMKRQGDVGSNPSKYSINDKVDIMYNPEKVEEFIIEGDTSSNVFGIVFIGIGILISILGVINKV